MKKISKASVKIKGLRNMTQNRKKDRHKKVNVGKQ